MQARAEVEVVNIIDAQHETVHPMTSAARIVHGELSHVSGSTTRSS